MIIKKYEYVAGDCEECGKKYDGKALRRLMIGGREVNICLNCLNKLVILALAELNVKVKSIGVEVK